MRYAITGMLSCLLLIGCTYVPKETGEPDGRSVEQTKAFIEQAQDIRQFYSLDGREIEWDEDFLKNSLTEIEKTRQDYFNFKNAIENVSILK